MHWSKASPEAVFEFAIAKGVKRPDFDSHVLPLHETIKIHATVILRPVDLASVNYRRIKLIEQKRDREAL